MITPKERLPTSLQELMPQMPRKRGRPTNLERDLRQQSAKFFPGVIQLGDDDSPLPPVQNTSSTALSARNKTPVALMAAAMEQ